MAACMAARRRERSNDEVTVLTRWLLVASLHLRGGAKGHGGAETSASGREGRSGRVSHGKLVLAVMADVHGAVVCSHTVLVVEVKWVAALASRPYNDNGPG